MSHLGPIGQLNMQPKDVIIVEIDNNGKIIGSFHNKNGPVSVDIFNRLAVRRNRFLKCKFVVDFPFK